MHLWSNLDNYIFLIHFYQSPDWCTNWKIYVSRHAHGLKIKLLHVFIFHKLFVNPSSGRFFLWHQGAILKVFGTDHPPQVHPYTSYVVASIKFHVIKLTLSTGWLIFSTILPDTHSHLTTKLWRLLSYAPIPIQSSEILILRRSFTPIGYSCPSN